MSPVERRFFVWSINLMERRFHLCCVEAISGGARRGGSARRTAAGRRLCSVASNALVQQAIEVAHETQRVSFTDKRKTV
jgi:molybdenum-dependent DNA-binding transcriptional regulator ModE